MSTFEIFCLFVIFAITFSHALPATTVPSLPTCKTKNANVNECIKAHLQEAIKYSKQGSPKLSIPPMDPYFIPRIVIPPLTKDGVNVEMTNSTVYGFSKARINKIQSDPLNGIFDIHYTTPESKFLGNYNLTGKMFAIPINGKGKSEVSLYDLHHAVKIKGEVKNNLNGNKYLHVKSVTVHLKPMRAKLQFNHLFKDNKELGDVINQMLNDNWQDIFIKLQPRMEEEMSKHIFKFTTDFFKTTPYNEIFPDV